MSERMQILEMIEAGEISAAEGARRLEAMAEPAQPAHSPEAARIALPAWVRRICQAVFWSGTTLTAGGALLLTVFYAGKAGVGSAICGWPLFVVGLLGLLLGLWLPNVTWFSLRVREQDSQRISLALPLPLGPIAWILRLVRPFVPQLQDMAVDEVILALREEVRKGHPFVVDVDEGRNGERVHVTIG
ncbi:MAG: hypothetical protein JW918_17205 [Anaerolineae bacterium]|nr:hypothetical protein [Anaerolineae bacterium]